ncbi:hypothetical protein [Blastopirellula marina]|nr:hypothetical protein [Blastopirellula marina]
MIHTLMLFALGLALLGVLPSTGSYRLPPGVFGLLVVLLVVMTLLF